MSAKGERGFTLLELLIAMTLLGLLMLGLFGGLRLGARVWEAGDARAADRTRIEAVQRFIRTYLGQARPLAAADNTGDDRIAFIGRRDGLDFSATLPAHLSAGGFAHVTLSFESLGEVRGLVLRHGPVRRRDDGRVELVRSDEAEFAMLLGDVEAVEFSYYGAGDADDDAEWTDRWVDEKNLPSLVRIRVRFADSDRRIWPELTVALRIQGQGSRAPSRRPRQ